MADAVRARMGGRGNHACADDATPSSVSPSSGSLAASPGSRQGNRNNCGAEERVGWKGRQLSCGAWFGYCTDTASSGCGRGMGSRKLGEAVAGDGSSESTVKLSCDSGTLSVSVSLHPN